MSAAASVPRPPSLPPELEPGVIDSLDHDETYAELELAEAALAGEHANGVRLDTVRLRTVDLSGSRLEHLSLTNAELSACDLSNVAAPRAELSCVTIDGGRLTGLRFTESDLRDVTFTRCRIDLAS